MTIPNTFTESYQQAEVKIRITKHSSIVHKHSKTKTNVIKTNEKNSQWTQLNNNQNNAAENIELLQ